jgi:hypothetical protein
MNEEPKYMDLDDNIILFCAFRYALGRRTYVVSTVIRRLIDQYLNIHPVDREKYVEEIDKADKENDLGSSYDREDWMKVKALFTEENHCFVDTYLNQEDLENNKLYGTFAAVKHDGKYFSLDMKSHYHTCKEIKNEK